MKLAAKIYAALLGLVVIYAWLIEVFALFRPPSEHLLGFAILTYFSLPTSLTLDLAYQRWPAFFATPFVELGYLTFGALLQASIVFAIATLGSKLVQRMSRKTPHNA